MVSLPEYTVMFRRTVLAAAGLALVAIAPVSAQVLGLPVVNSGVPVGIQVAADVGFANADFSGGKGTTVGASAAIGVGFFGVGGQVARFSPKTGDAVTSTGLNASLRLLGGPLVPFRIMAMGGVAHWSVSSVGVTHIPLSIGLAATIPNPAFGIKPWIAPRLDVVRSNGTSDSNFGLSAGIDLAMLNGLSIRGAYDRVMTKDRKPSIISFGVGFAL
jgi:hypothetical protein